MTRFKFLLIVAVLVGFAALAYAGFDEGKVALDRGDYARAYKEFKPLAEQGDVQAQYNLGVLYHNGTGVPQDYAEAVKWCRKAAEQGDARAQSDLGAAYHKGEGVQQDYVEAAKWIRKAAEQGIAQAQYNLGLMYLNGQAVPQDFVLAHMWYNLSAAQGISEAQKMRDILVKYMTPSQVAEAQRLARKWKPKSKD